MRCHCTLNLRLDPKQPRAFADFLEAMRRHCTAKATSVLELWLTVGRRNGLLLDLARSLPPDAAGFSIGGDSITAGEVLQMADRKGARGLSGGASFRGDLLHSFDFDAALQFVQQWAALDAAVPGAFGHLSARDVALGGSPEGAQINIGLHDLTQHPKKRATAYLACDLSVETDDRAGLKRMLSALEDGSGFPWRRAAIQFVPDVQGVAAEDEAYRIACLRFLGVAMDRIAEGLRAEALHWGDFPRLRTGNSGFQERMQDVMASRGVGSVGWKGAVKAFMKRRFAQFEVRETAHQFDFVETLRSDAELVLTFDKIHYSGLGKAYTVFLGFRRKAPPAAGFPFLQPLFRFFGHGDGLGWVYTTGEDLTEDLEETGRLIALVLPHWRRACLAFLETNGSAVPEPGADHGALSLHEAIAVAARALGSLDPHFDIVLRGTMGLGGGPAAAMMPLPPAARGDTSGRLRPGRSWDILFGNRATGRTVTVMVPYSGAMRFALGFGVWIGDADSSFGKKRIEEPVAADDLLMLPDAPRFQPDAYVATIMASLAGLADSPRLLEYAEEIAGRAFRSEHPECGMRTVFNVDLLAEGGTRPYWYVAYTALGQQRLETALHITAAEPFEIEEQSSGTWPDVLLSARRPAGAGG